MRITIDVDDPDKFWDSARRLHLLTGLTVYYRKSANKGYHLKVHNFKGSYVEVIGIRVLAGDDIYRIKIDSKATVKPTQVLWTIKHGKEAGNWRKIPNFLLG